RLSARAKQFNEAVAIDRKIERAASVFKIPLLIDCKRAPRRDARQRRLSRQLGAWIVRIAYLRDQFRKLDVRSLKGGRVQVGDVVSDNVERFLLGRQAHAADFKCRIHEFRPKVAIDWPIRES